ncbi:hypothetical protein HK105_205846 [Polyrhizophydium stewartii]|uniref:G protein-coupled receptor n=1 Tax=Polyrhizophydium stewartii TaxID=2732419 RepID=A0ABR4N599_9FUNG
MPAPPMPMPPPSELPIVSGFFSNHWALEHLRPTFDLAVEYTALLTEIVGLLVMIGNCVFLGVKLSQTLSRKILMGMLVVSILMTVSIFFHILMIYLVFWPAVLTVTTWTLGAAQIAILVVETDSLAIFVPRFGDAFATKLKWIHMILHLALATPNYFHGPYFIGYEDPDPIQTWYNYTFTLWGFYIFAFDFYVAARITAEVVSLSKLTIGSGPHDKQNKTRAVTSERNQKFTILSRLSLNSVRRAKMEGVQAEFNRLVRRAYISIAVFASVDLANCAVQILSTTYWISADPMKRRVALALLQIGLAASGFHVVAVTLLMHNMARIISMNKLENTQSETSAAAAAPPMRSMRAISSDL